MIGTWILLGLFVGMILGGFLFAWVNRPVRAPDDRDEGDAAFLRASNVVNQMHDMGGHLGGDVRDDD